MPVHLRPAGQAFQVICMHAFGDVPLPPITGVIQGLPSDSSYQIRSTFPATRG